MAMADPSLHPADKIAFRFRQASRPHRRGRTRIKISRRLDLR
jgi:hypothetical protein